MYISLAYHQKKEILRSRDIFENFREADIKRKKDCFERVTNSLFKLISHKNFYFASNNVSINVWESYAGNWSLPSFLMASALKGKPDSSLKDPKMSSYLVQWFVWVNMPHQHHRLWLGVHWSGSWVPGKLRPANGSEWSVCWDQGRPGCVTGVDWSSSSRALTGTGLGVDFQVHGIIIFYVVVSSLANYLLCWP